MPNGTDFSDYKEQLKIKGISLRGLASMSGRNVSTIKQVLDGTYKGRQTTVDEIMCQVKLALQDREDLNPIIYGNIELSRKVFFNAMKSHKFDSEETGIILNIVKKLESYQEATSGIQKESVK